MEIRKQRAHTCKCTRVNVFSYIPSPAMSRKEPLTNKLDYRTKPGDKNW